MVGKRSILWLVWSLLVFAGGCTPNVITLGSAGQVTSVPVNSRTAAIVNQEQTNGSYFLMSAIYVPPAADALRRGEAIDLEGLCESGKLRLAEKQIAATLYADVAVNGESLSQERPVFAFRFDNSDTASCNIFGRKVYFTGLNLLTEKDVSVDTVFENHSGSAAAYAGLVDALTTVANVGSVVSGGGLLVSAGASASLAQAVGATQDYTRKQLATTGKREATLTFHVLNGDASIEQKKLIPIFYRDNHAKPAKDYAAGAIEIDYLPCLTRFSRQVDIGSNGYPDFSRLTLDDLPDLLDGNKVPLRQGLDKALAIINTNPKLGIVDPPGTVRTLKGVLDHYPLSRLDQAAITWVALQRVDGFDALLDLAGFRERLATPGLSLKSLQALKQELEQARDAAEKFRALVDVNGAFTKTGLAGFRHQPLIDQAAARIAVMEKQEQEKADITRHSLGWSNAINYLMGGFAGAIKMDDEGLRKALLRTKLLDGKIVVENASASELLAGLPTKPSAVATEDVVTQLTALHGENFGCFFDITKESHGVKRARQINAGSLYKTVALYRDQNHAIGNNGFLLFYQSHAYQDNNPENEVRISALGIKYPSAGVYDIFKGWAGQDSKCSDLLETFKLAVAPDKSVPEPAPVVEQSPVIEPAPAAGKTLATGSE